MSFPPSKESQRVIPTRAQRLRSVAFRLCLKWTREGHFQSSIAVFKVIVGPRHDFPLSAAIAPFCGSDQPGPVLLADRAG
jgi:hypothetical protein